MKLIEKFSAFTTDLTKDQVGRNRLAVDFAKLEFDKKRLTIAVLGTGITIAGLAFAVYQFTENASQARAFQEAQAIEAEKNRKAARETQFALKFFELGDDEERGSFIENLKAFGDFDSEFIAKLEASLTPSTEVPQNIAANLNENTQSALDQLQQAFEGLVSRNTELRRQSRGRVAEQLVSCGEALCVDFLNDIFEVDNLTTSERYRLALGITVAIHSIPGDIKTPGSEFDRLFSNYPRLSEIVKKLEELSDFQEPALKKNSELALAKLQ